MTWLVNGETIARKVKNPTHGVHGHSGSGRSIQCASCGDVFDQSNLSPEWPGLPAGVKFDPSDQELLEHLAAKVGLMEAKPHPFIEVFIPTLDGEDGICYTHPKKLPDIRVDGTSIHYFHRPARAYTTGTRKRRKIQQGEDSGNGGEVRWHKTGKTRPVVENGTQLGFKKIMVLYTSYGTKAKPDKTNWVMHQYHLGLHEEEREGEYVVSKIFYQTQPRQSGIVRKGDDDDPEQAVLESAEEPAYFVPRSSIDNTMAGSASIFTPGGKPCMPITRSPLDAETVEQRRGLFHTLSEAVDRMWSESLSGNFQSSEQTGAIKGSPEMGEKGTHFTLEGIELQNACELQPVNDLIISGLQTPQVDGFSDVRGGRINDSDLLKLLANENIQAALKLKSKHDVGEGIADETGFKTDISNGGDMGNKFEALENIILDTPPDFIMESLLNSQEALDVLEKFKLWSDSQKNLGSDDPHFTEFLRDSQI